MKRALLVFGIVGCVGIVLIALWMVRTNSAAPTQRKSFGDSVTSAITNPAGFAKSHFTGGIGAVLTIDPMTGGTMINQVMSGSPAEAAGLRQGDHILKVNGVSTTGQKLAQVVESVRGFTVSSVTLTVQRAGSTTNMDFILPRSSWERLGVPQQPTSTVLP